MKKIYLLSGFLMLLMCSVNAQTFVSTSPENKNIVLEEYTGIYCGFCPQGHKIAQDLHDANPSDVVLVNIHTGNYANPNTGDPDFRTAYGTAFASQFGVTGYPAGTVNRRPFPNTGPNSNPSLTGMNGSGGAAMSRGYWNTVSSVVLAESSCVNVAAQSSIDIGTRELTVNVEAYYTANSNVSTNKLNVALLQNKIEGPQSGSSGNTANVLPNGNYNHMHMLRHLLTGQWGESIDTTSSGTFISRTYTYTIPADLNNIAYELFNLEVVVFIAEGNDEALTGSQSSMTYIAPPGISFVDLEAKGNMTDPTDYCASSITPSIKVTNNTSIAVSSFDVSYSINNGTAVSNTINTSLASGASTTYDFSSIAPSNGANNISYSVSVSGLYYDSLGSNNSIVGNSFNVISNSSIGTTHSEDFESYSLADDVITNAIEINEGDERLYVVDKTVASPALSFSIGGHGNSENSLRHDLIGWSSASSEASVVFEKVNFSSAISPTIDFTYATTGFMYSGTEYNDGRFVVSASKDCGITWTSLFDKTGSALQTTAVTTGAAERLYPQSGDWATISLDASSLAGESEVIVQFKGSNSNGGWGNAIYLDDINIGLENTGINGLLKTNGIELYPNPTSGVINIATDLKGSYNISLFDLLGKKVKNYFNLSKDIVSLDLRSLNKGVYMIELTQGESVWTEKLILE